MKDPLYWEEEDLQSLILSGTQESISLDYKRCSALENNERNKLEISKDISAFANSAGGTIIYGIIEINNLPAKIDEGFNPTITTREWLEDIIDSRIQRRIKNIKIKQIELKKSNPGKVIYIVSIPQSKEAPHMAHDKRYYKRYNFKSAPMEEYEVRDISNRPSSPDLDVIMFTDDKNVTESGLDFSLSNKFRISFSITNNSSVVANYFVFKLYFDKRLNAEAPSPLKATLHKTDMSLLINNDIIPVTGYYFNSSTPSRMPVWQGLTYNIFEEDITISIPDNNASYYLMYSISAPSMMEKQTVIEIQCLSDKIHIEKYTPPAAR